MIEAVIIEDKKRNASFLKSLLKEYCPDIVLIGEANSVTSGVELIKKEKPSLLFLDIELPDGTSFELLEQIEEKNFNIIFTTAHDHYALKAIKFSALDYLLKPINFRELQDAVQKVRSKDMNGSIALNNINILMKNMAGQAEKSSGKIALPTADGHLFIDTNKIIRFEAEGSYSYVFLVNKEKIIVTRNLKDFELLINENDFVRVHHSHLVNIHHVQKYVRGAGGQIIMDDGSKVEVSTRKKEEFLRKMRAK